jgi:prepilin-type N-terminal cleavage/methylation domain-containing protein
VNNANELINNPPLFLFTPQSKNMNINKSNRKAGFTLVEIMIVVAIIGLLAAIAIPNFVKARTTAQKNACINNLRQIDGAKEQWALETKQAPGAAADQNAINQYIKGTATPVCPANGTYTYNPVDQPPTCSLGGAPTLHTL